MSSSSNRQRQTPLHGEIPFFRSKGSGISSNMSASASPQSAPMSTESMEARLLSQATSTATVAAKSILEAGGSEATALKTAKAAAKSVLNLDDDAGSSIGGFNLFRRHRSRRRAEVVASMALVTAANSLRTKNDWGDASSSMNYSLENQSMANTSQVLTPSGVPTSNSSYQGSGASNYRAPPESPSIMSVGNSSNGGGGRPPIPNTPMRRMVPVEPTIAEKSDSRDPSNEISDEGSSVKPSSIRVPTPEALSIAEAVAVPVAAQSPSHKKPSPSPKIVSEHLMAEDPIYYQEESLADLRGVMPTIESRLSDETGDTLFTNEDEKEMVRYTAPQEKTFISKHVDPVLLSFDKLFSCGAVEDVEVVVNGDSMEDRVITDDEKDNEDDDDDDDEDDDDDDDDDDMGTTTSSESSIDSATILRELNLSSDLEDSPHLSAAPGLSRQKSATKSVTSKKSDSNNPKSDEATQQNAESRQDTEVITSILEVIRSNSHGDDGKSTNECLEKDSSVADSTEIEAAPRKSWRLLMRGGTSRRTFAKKSDSTAE